MIVLEKGEEEEEEKEEQLTSDFPIPSPPLLPHDRSSPYVTEQWAWLLHFSIWVSQ